MFLFLIFWCLVTVKEEPPDEFDEIDKIKKKRKEISMEIDDQQEEMEGPPETCAQLFNMPTKSGMIHVFW